MRTFLPLLLLAAAIGLLATRASAENIDPNNDMSQYAWGENAGWINAEPANCGNCGVTVAGAKLLGYAWGENIGWVNLNCSNTTCAGPSGTWGVTNDGAGHLAGYAWGENAGWLSFSCHNREPGTSCASAGNYGVSINPSTGKFSGYAWGENIGWVSFSCQNTGSCPSVQYGVRTSWPESDGDGYTDAAEVAIGTDPYNPCGGGGWPSNVFDGGMSANKLDVQDIVSFVSPARHLDTSPPTDPNYSVRWDLTPGPTPPFTKYINILDITTLLNAATGNPPMFSGTRAFGKTCPSPP